MAGMPVKLKRNRLHYTCAARQAPPIFRLSRTGIVRPFYRCAPAAAVGLSCPRRKHHRRADFFSDRAACAWQNEARQARRTGDKNKSKDYDNDRSQ